MNRRTREEFELQLALMDKDYRELVLRFEGARAQLEVCQKEKTAAEEWINAVRDCIFALIEKYPTFNHEWGGDRNGWGFSFEWVKWVLLRAQEAERERDTLLALLREVWKCARSCDCDSCNELRPRVVAALAAHKEPV